MKKPVLFLGFLFLETDLLLELGILAGLVQSRSNLRVQHLEFWKILPRTDREDFNSSNESTISTSLIHNVASDGKSEQVATWFLNRIFHTKNGSELWNLSKCNSDICCLCCPTRKFCGISTGSVERTVDGLPANVGIGIVPLFCSSPLAKRVADPAA